MSQIDAREDILSEDKAEHLDSTTESLKFVPVAESIRYRRRAQSAEKKVETLTEQLMEVKSQVQKTAEQLSGVQKEQELMRKLAAGGAVDLETAVLVAKARVGGQSDVDLDDCVEQLKKEKRYLFGNNNGGTSAAQKTAGARDHVQNSQTILERAAKKAATTGNRTDLQEYLKLRRNFV